MINVEKINLQYGGKPILKDLSMTLGSNEKIVIYGESGSGKSSFFKLLLGFEQANSGSISIDGIVQTPKSTNEVRKAIAWVPQEISIPVKTLKEAADQLYSLKCNVHNRPTETEILDLVQRLGVDLKTLDKNMSDLSGGERQRFFITLALLLRKPLLLLDEPTSALDALNSKRLGDVLKSFDMSMIAISHDPIFVASFDRTIEFLKLSH